MSLDPDEYLNRSVWVRITPSIHGVGVSAIRDIPKGVRITDYDNYGKTHVLLKGEVTFFNYTDQLLSRLHPAITKMIHDRFILYPEARLQPSPNFLQLYREYINYSEFPNVNQRMVSMRKIHEGEELLQRYPMDGARISSISHHRYIYNRGGLRRGL